MLKITNLLIAAALAVLIAGSPALANNGDDGPVILSVTVGFDPDTITIEGRGRVWLWCGKRKLLK